MKNKYEVWHAKEPNFGIGKPREFPAEFDHVATVEAEGPSAIDKVFELTNHIEKPWWENEGVDLKVQSRSTSVGDVVTHNDEAFRCESFGWKEMGMCDRAGVVYLKDELWVVELQDSHEVLTILDQYPHHSELYVGRDENRRVTVNIKQGEGGKAAEFVRFM